MRKTILTVAIALLCMVTGVRAESNNNMYTLSESVLMAKPAELNSFCKAIVKGDLATVKRLIELGEDVNQKSLGKTPAIYAARYNKVEILELLIANGANLKIKCDNGRSVQKHAELSNATEALEVIKAHLKK
ncbi:MULTISPECIES: ankyrin repeat domain-containing protein [unclassified Arenibacter]|uniref:ankyrin repeat domain-containing protein n=1 Tax=unclassified Arenibacter TaxID=2615047 RepID=UPI000E34C675|nr:MULTISPECIES: ankyrin repeat domain-containing protein [unclassified Arenibacter]MCM4164190.1 ankyrin repeat domain-containing protein [Arenibacter sp. A80]RFT55986.1 ankyrin repeat domain-containing protein [Arenibacter sp. P308M17]